ncbi:MAG TPA: SRPBCC domain-containing protein [Nitrososphaerales archaeon]|nr:SRPBCC domain-containing protein [Nitrososphaerales archaeon]
MNSTELTAKPGKQEYFVMREFDAPTELVFKSFVDPKLYSQWRLGPKRMGLTMRLDKYDPRTGGAWRLALQDRDGKQSWFHGSYHEVLAPELIVETFEFEGSPERGHPTLETFKFEALPDGRTRLTIHSVFQSVADRDRVMGTSWEEGQRDSLDRLDELTKSLGQVSVSKRNQ